MSDTVIIAVEERGNTPYTGDNVIVGDDVYEVVRHLGLDHSRPSGHGAPNVWRFEAKLIGSVCDIYDEGEDQYEYCGEIEE